MFLVISLLIAAVIAILPLFREPSIDRPGKKIKKLTWSGYVILLLLLSMTGLDYYKTKKSEGTENVLSDTINTIQSSLTEERRLSYVRDSIASLKLDTLSIQLKNYNLTIVGNRIVRSTDPIISLSGNFAGAKMGGIQNVKGNKNVQIQGEGSHNIIGDYNQVGVNGNVTNAIKQRHPTDADIKDIISKLPNHDIHISFAHIGSTEALNFSREIAGRLLNLGYRNATMRYAIQTWNEGQTSYLVKVQNDSSAYIVINPHISIIDY